MLIKNIYLESTILQYILKMGTLADSEMVNSEISLDVFNMAKR